MKEDVAKATEDGTVLPIVHSNVYLFKIWERDFCTTSIVLYVLCVTIV